MKINYTAPQVTLMKAWYASFHGPHAALHVISCHGPLHYIPVSARCSLSLCPPERWRRSLNSLSPRPAPLQRYPFISALCARSLSGITWRHLKVCVRGSNPRRGYNVAEQAVPLPAAVLGTVLSRPQHLLSHIWQHWRDLTGIAACQMDLSALLLRALSNKANLSPPSQSLFTALISPSYFYTFLIAMALNRKLIKSLKKKKAPTYSAVVTWIKIISNAIPDIVSSRYQRPPYGRWARVWSEVISGCTHL